MVAVGCALEAQYIKRENEIKKTLRDAWKRFIQKQGEKKK